MVVQDDPAVIEMCRIVVCSFFRPVAYQLPATGLSRE